MAVDLGQFPDLLLLLAQLSNTSLTLCNCSGFSQIATVNARGADIRVDAVELKDAAASTHAFGIVISLRETGDTPRENRAFIDYDEIDRLLKAVDSIARVNETVTKLASFEARYRTLGDLEI